MRQVEILTIFFHGGDALWASLFWLLIVIPVSLFLLAAIGFFAFYKLVEMIERKIKSKDFRSPPKK